MLKKISQSDFIKRCQDLNMRKTLDWCTLYNDKEYLYYSFHKATWQDSNICLIGGYGYDVKCCNIYEDAEENIAQLIIDYFKMQGISHNELIGIEED